MKKNIYFPHDRLFKFAMSNIRVARQFFEIHLPNYLLDHIDLDSLTLQNPSFISGELKKVEADVVYSAKTRGGCETRLIYLLAEAQATPDKHMSLRVADYKHAIIQNHRKLYPCSPLPLVYSIVLYIGNRSWHVPPNVFEMYGDFAGIAERIAMEDLNVIKLQSIGDDILKQQFWSGLMEFVLKHRTEVDDLNYYQQLLPWLQNMEKAQEDNLVEGVLQYTLYHSEKVDKQLLFQIAKQFKLGVGEKVMTLAHTFEERGRKKGMHQGMHQGIHQGRCEVAINLLKQSFSLDQVAEFTGLAITDVMKLTAALPEEEKE